MLNQNKTFWIWIQYVQEINGKTQTWFKPHVVVAPDLTWRPNLFYSLHKVTSELRLQTSVCSLSGKQQDIFYGLGCECTHTILLSCPAVLFINRIHKHLDIISEFTVKHVMTSLWGRTTFSNVKYVLMGISAQNMWGKALCLKFTTVIRLTAS